MAFEAGLEKRDSFEPENDPMATPSNLHIHVNVPIEYESEYND